MNIFFDFEITEKEIQFTEKGKDKLEFIRQHIHDRVKILANETAAYPKGFIFYNIFGMADELNGNDPIPLGIQFMNFPPELENKLENCFTDDDYRYLAYQIKNILL